MPTPRRRRRLVTKAITKAPPPVTQPQSTGFYIGVNGGYGWNRATFYSPPGSTTIDCRPGWPA